MNPPRESSSTDILSKAPRLAPSLHRSAQETAGCKRGRGAKARVLQYTNVEKLRRLRDILPGTSGASPAPTTKRAGRGVPRQAAQDRPRAGPPPTADPPDGRAFRWRPPPLTIPSPKSSVA